MTSSSATVDSPDFAHGVGTDEDRQLKARHRALWALGDYPAVAARVIPSLGATLVDACGIAAGDRVLDVAAGAGNAAIPAALAGGDVVACDLTPELLAAGAAEAEARGARVTWEQADAEALPYDDGAFDAVLSCVGVMFAPHHGAAAAELARVTRPGGTIGLINWTPEGFIGQMFATMKAYVPAPPPGVHPPPLWGNVDHLGGLFGESVSDLTVARAMASIDIFASGEEFLDFFKAHYGPTVAAYRGLADQPERAAMLDEQLVDLARSFDLGGGRMEWEYLLVTARRA